LEEDDEERLGTLMMTDLAEGALEEAEEARDLAEEGRVFCFCFFFGFGAELFFGEKIFVAIADAPLSSIGPTTGNTVEAMGLRMLLNSPVKKSPKEFMWAGTPGLRRAEARCWMISAGSSISGEGRRRATKAAAVGFAKVGAISTKYLNVTVNVELAAKPVR
jgi:hypothetical protein